MDKVTADEMTGGMISTARDGTLVTWGADDKTDQVPFFSLTAFFFCHFLAFLSFSRFFVVVSLSAQWFASFMFSLSLASFLFHVEAPHGALPKFLWGRIPACCLTNFHHSRSQHQLREAS